MKTPVLLLTILFCSGSIGLAQATRDSNAPVGISEAQRIYYQLIQIRGPQGQIPALLLLRKQERIIDSSPKQIRLELAAYEACLSLQQESETALAYLLAHELCHQQSSSRCRFADTPESMARASNPSEEEIDYQAALHCFLMGLRIERMSSLLIPALWQRYKGEGVASQLQARARIMEQTRGKMRSFGDLYDMATVLTALQRYEEAASYLDLLREDIQQAAFYNHLGTLYLLSSLAYFEREELPFLYPIEDSTAQMDLSTMRQRSLVRVAQRSDEVQQRGLLIDRALQRLHRAATLDSTNLQIQTNLICAHLLRAQDLQFRVDYNISLLEFHYVMAEQYIAALRWQADQQGAEERVAASYLLEGMLAFLQGRPADVEAFFAQAEVHPVTSLNRSLLEAVALTELRPSSYENTLTSVPERIAGNSPADLLQQLDDLKWLSVSEAQNVKNRLLRHRTKGSAVTSLWHRATPGQEVLVLISPESNELRSGRGIRRGDAEELVRERYGAQLSELELPYGRVLHAPQEKILFYLRDGQVQRWMIYQ